MLSLLSNFTFYYVQDKNLKYEYLIRLMMQFVSLITVMQLQIASTKRTTHHYIERELVK